MIGKKYPRVRLEKTFLSNSDSILLTGLYPLKREMVVKDGIQIFPYGRESIIKDITDKTSNSSFTQAFGIIR